MHYLRLLMADNYDQGFFFSIHMHATVKKVHTFQLLRYLPTCS